MKLPKTYEAQSYETDIYALWEKTGVFKANPESKKEHFSISMPPPNETGTLSIGHALFLTMQDIMSRHARQQGKDVLWLPGTDHAALPVNAIIEKQLADEGTDKHQIGREAFLEKTREFVSGSRDTMLGQMRAMGASADWSRLRYTLDDALNRCVNETFVKMYNDGLIYRGNRVVNWDPQLETNISDDEVEYVEEKGKFYTFKYGPFEIGTARPETKFGDKYVVMHPDDERYSQYNHGDTFDLEWINGPIKATIIKDKSVDPEFGTGVMTITPWHSLVDFEIAETYKLDKEQIIDFHGNLLPIAKEFAGMTIEEARPKIVEKLESKGLLVNIDDNYVHSVAVNERGKAKIEPQIRLQWFIDVNKQVVPWKGKTLSLKEVLQSVIREGDIEIIPKRFEKIYFSWIDNLRDWCISRQIWWGHRVPVWYRHDTDNREDTYAGIQQPKDDGSEGWNEWEQDPDTLDTWFSSALWTWSTLVNPEKAKDYNLSLEDILKNSLDYQAYHPTSVMETGWDILFFWVARMILATTYMTGEVPFKKVYLHGLIRSEDGKKMSKSRPESIIDPLDIIPKYGTDALRMALIMGVTPGNDQTWGWSKIEANQKFANKVWNIARYIEGLVDQTQLENRDVKVVSSADHWIIERLDYFTKKISGDMDSFGFSEAYDSLYHFIWDDLADWYIEASKVEPNLGLLAYLLESILILMHPFAPFLTETIWQTLAWEEGSILASKELTEIVEYKAEEASDFAEVQKVVKETRYLQKAISVSKVTLRHSGEAFYTVNADVVKRLANLGEIISGPQGDGIELISTKHRAWLDVDKSKATKYVNGLLVKKDNQSGLVSQLEARLNNASYVQNAPAELVDQTRQHLDDAKVYLSSIESEIQRFKTKA
jgi:valyl-tRNA synthetase